MIRIFIIIALVSLENSLSDNYKAIFFINTKLEQMNFNNEFTTLVEQHEGFRSEAYKDANNNWTIGFGTLLDTIDAIKQYVTDKQVVTKDTAEQMLFFVAGKESYILNSLIAHGLVLNQNQFNALGDFAYNTGINALLSSTLLKTIKANPNNFNAIKVEFLKWDKVVKVDAHGNGDTVELPGLKSRRLDEFNLYSKPI